MIEIDVPGQRVYRLEHLVLDLNGTIALDGSIIKGVPERLDLLRRSLNIIVVTADTRGSTRKLRKGLQVNIHQVSPGDEQLQKLKFVQQLGSNTTVVLGNGSNDASMLKESILGICVLGAEGASAEAIASCDVLVADINAGLDLLIKPIRLIATLRK
ncbi:MAG: ATPase P [Dehalococcoidia bacterium]